MHFPVLSHVVECSEVPLFKYWPMKLRHSYSTSKLCFLLHYICLKSLLPFIDYTLLSVSVPVQYTKFGEHRHHFFHSTFSFCLFSLSRVSDRLELNTDLASFFEGFFPQPKNQPAVPNMTSLEVLFSVRIW